MNISKRILIGQALAACITLHNVSGMVSPTSQEDASEWLEIRVTGVEATAQEGDPEAKDVTAQAEVLHAFKTATELEEGDRITIAYTHDPRPKYSEDGKRMLGPSSPALLKNGRQTYAFLEAGPEKGVYQPGASAWSFAPPFGIPAEERDKLGMKAPTPPKAPPPPPPNFQVPMRAPSPPALKPSKMGPPAPPPAPPAEASDNADS